MKPDILRQFPLVKKCFGQQRDMGMDEPGIVKQQERAIELIAAEGTGSKEEMEASMICAALMLNPMSLYADLGRFWDGYSEEVGNMINSMLATAPGSMMPLTIAQGTAATGIAQMEEVLGKLQKGTLAGKPEDILEGVRQAYGQDMEVFAYLEAPELLARYETTRDSVFSALEGKLTPDTPAPPRPRKPGNGDFSF